MSLAQQAEIEALKQRVEALEKRLGGDLCEACGGNGGGPYAKCPACNDAGIARKTLTLPGRRTSA